MQISRDAWWGAVIEAGEDQKFQGVLGSAVVKVFDLTLAKTGIKRGRSKEINLPYKSITVQAPSPCCCLSGSKKDYDQIGYMKKKRKGYWAHRWQEKKESLKGWIGKHWQSIRKMTTEELGKVDFCYSPPYATPWDAVQIAANAAK